MDITINASGFAKHIKREVRLLYPDAFDIDVLLNKIRYLKTEPTPYFDDGDMVAKYIDRATIHLEINIDYPRKDFL